MSASITTGAPAAGAPALVPDLVPDLTPEQLDQLLSSPDTPLVLLDLWAPWCQPCLAQAPTLQRLAAATEGRLKVVKLDVQRHPAVAAGLKVRGIPLLVLFREGREVARVTGLQTFEQLCHWIDESGAADLLIDLSAPAFRSPPPLDGAFYGDDSLRRFLLERAVTLAESGQIENLRFPGWAGDRGSVSCALVRHDDPEVFARVTGLPASFGACLHFADITTPQALREVFGVLPAGADTRGVPARLMQRWLGDATLDWPGLLGAEADAVRRDWLHLVQEQLFGEPPLPTEWNALKERADALMDPAPLHVVPNHLGRMLSRLSPLPAHDEINAWGPALYSTGTYFVLSFVGLELGWTHADYAMEVIRMNWYKAECPDPFGKSAEEMAALHARFDAEHVALVTAHADKQKRFHEVLTTRVPHFRDKLRAQLVEVLREVSSH